MSERRSFLDDLDKKIIRELQVDCRINLVELEKKLGVAKSTIHYRINRLEEEKIITGYSAKIDLFKLADDFEAVVLIRSKYGPEYSDKIKLLFNEIPGIWAVYNVLGDIDFVILMRADNREEFVKNLEKIESSKLVERTSTVVIANILKEEEKYVPQIDKPE